MLKTLMIEQVIHGHFAGITTATLQGNSTATLQENPLAKIPITFR
jgi:hypothetical protein